MAYLILADGTTFKGESIGKEGTVIGETVFTTGMTGYLETLTDPSYYGQIVTQTFPLIGNYGVIPEDFESKKSHIRGYIVREICSSPSNFREQGCLNDFLKEQNIIGICGIDTRRLTKILRESGVMNGMIVSGESDEAKKIINSLSSESEKEKLLEKIRSYSIVDAVKSVSVSEFEKIEGRNIGSVTRISASGAKAPAGSSSDSTIQKNYKILLWDFGAKYNIGNELRARGMDVTEIPYNTTAQQIISEAPDGIMLSNGPGDPAENTEIIAEIKKICDYNRENPQKQIAIFGICLGHQMLAISQGAKTLKLKYGHRGGNQPVKYLNTGRVYISSQNHGYAVDTESLPENAILSFINTNDKTCEGLDYKDIPAFSVQFHPEACSGPHDTNFLFDRFVQEIESCH